MSINFVITAIGTDRPGLVEQLSSVIRAHEGNWLESSMAHLAGKFAGIVRIDVAPARAEALLAALQGLADLRVVVERADVTPAVAASRTLSLSLVGHDRIGIVQEVAAVLARHRVNVEDLATRTSSAPMSGEILFHAEARLALDATTDVDALQAALESLSNELVVELTLAEV